MTPTTSTLSRYIAFMSISTNSLDSYLLGITFKLHPHFPEVVGVRNSPYINSVLKGMERLHGVPDQWKEPLSFTQLNVIATHYKAHPSYNNSLFLALILMGFFGLPRLGEITNPNDNRLVNWWKTIWHDLLEVSGTQFGFILPASKTDRFFAGNQVLIRSNSCANNPLDALKIYVQARDTCFPHNPWLWLTSDGVVPNRQWFLQRFHIHFDSCLTLNAGRGGNTVGKTRCALWNHTGFRALVIWCFSHLHPHPSLITLYKHS